MNVMAVLQRMHSNSIRHLLDREPSIGESTRQINEQNDALEAVRKLVDDVRGIYQYGSDTLSGCANGPDDREWQRAGVLEMTRRASAAIAAMEPPK